VVQEVRQTGRKHEISRTFNNVNNLRGLDGKFGAPCLLVPELAISTQLVDNLVSSYCGESTVNLVLAETFGLGNSLDSTFAGATEGD